MAAHLADHTTAAVRPGPRRELAPFLAAVVVAFALAPLTEGRNDYRILLAGLATLLLISAITLLVNWSRWPPRAQAAPPLAMFVVIALLREGAGGAECGYSALVLLPLLWLALYGARVDLALGFLAMTATLSAPILLIGAPHYPETEWRRLIVWAIVGPIAGLLVQRLIHDRTRLLAQVHSLSRTDPLTGVANRRQWDEALATALARARRLGTPVSVAMLDLDHFKRLNDTRGHEVGDRCLRDTAAAWQHELRPGDLLARWGGEEFVVALEHCGPDEAREAIDRLREATPFGLTCSAGVAGWDGVESPERLVHRADVALYEAKRAGRDRTAIAAARAQAPV